MEGPATARAARVARACTDTSRLGLGLASSHSSPNNPFRHYLLTRGRWVGVGVVVAAVVVGVGVGLGVAVVVNRFVKLISSLKSVVQAPDPESPGAEALGEPQLAGGH